MAGERLAVGSHVVDPVPGDADHFDRPLTRARRSSSPVEKAAPAASSAATTPTGSATGVRVCAAAKVEPSSGPSITHPSGISMAHHEQRIHGCHESIFALATHRLCRRSTCLGVDSIGDLLPRGTKPIHNVRPEIARILDVSTQRSSHLSARRPPASCGPTPGARPIPRHGPGGHSAQCSRSRRARKASSEGRVVPHERAAPRRARHPASLAEASLSRGESLRPIRASQAARLRRLRSRSSRGHRRSVPVDPRRSSAASQSSMCPHARRRSSGLPRSPSPAVARRKYGNSCLTRRGSSKMSLGRGRRLNLNLPARRPAPAWSLAVRAKQTARLTCARPTRCRGGSSSASHCQLRVRPCPACLGPQPARMPPGPP